MIIGIDHGYYAMKTKQVCFPTGLMRYTYEPLYHAEYSPIRRTFIMCVELDGRP